MKRWLTLAALACTVAACNDAQPLAPERAPGSPNALLSLPATVSVDPVLSNVLRLAAPTDPIEVLVTYDSTANGDAVAGAVRAATSAGIVRFKHLPIVFTLATPAQITRISSTPGVVSLYANKQLRYHLAESVPSIRANVVHAAGYTGKGIGVAILDSGVDGLNADVAYPTHTVQNLKVLGSVEDLMSPDTAPVAATLFVENLPNTDLNGGHGTHVAGIAAGNGASSGGKYTGVAPGANLIGISTGETIAVFWALAAFDWLIDNQAKYNIKVVNNSWGTTGAYDPNDPTNVGTKEVYKAGIAVVFSAGNEGPGENTLNPYSAAPWVISVAAGCKTVSPDPTNSATLCAGGTSMLADFSSRGIRGDALVHPDITAPGALIVSARASTGTTMNGLNVPDDALSCATPQLFLPYYTCMSGTSMSAPHVTGTIALMQEAARGKLSPDQVYRALTRNARRMVNYGEWEVGAGYLDAYAAVMAVRR
ncbi:MAG TPA: S8 family serine peptidase [Longimicrobium sp.]|jgi:serine protease AprX|nr:S8 family serine peptidase [Longimicrobium sp.]